MITFKNFSENFKINYPHLLLAETITTDWQVHNYFDHDVGKTPYDTTIPSREIYIKNIPSNTFLKNLN